MNVVPVVGRRRCVRLRGPRDSSARFEPKPGSNSSRPRSKTGRRVFFMSWREFRLDLYGKGETVAALTQVDHLKMLEAESIFILREAAAEFAHPVMLYSIG